jgi:predicted RNase H-like nuclease
MSTLLVGFDSAWTAKNSGAIASVLVRGDGTKQELGLPVSVDYSEAEQMILKWQAEHDPTSTIVLLDQPTIVRNRVGQRPVEHIVSSAVSRRYGGMQPANTGKREMFGVGAPVWSFLARFGGPANPLVPSMGTQVFETYPVLVMISLGWTLPDLRPAGRLPKYNPARITTFSRADWVYVCIRARNALLIDGLVETSRWIDRASQIESPRKGDQDQLDACLCLLAALHLFKGKDCLMVGDQQSGYIIVPHSMNLCAELEARCRRTERIPSEWIRTCRVLACQAVAES